MFAYSYLHLKKFGFGNDLNFLPEELLNLYYYVFMVLNDDQKKLIKKLAPKKFFKSNIICKADIKMYEKHLLEIIQSWIQNNILHEDQVKSIHNLLTGKANLSFPNDSSEQYLLDNILPLLNLLKESDMCPVIIFNTDREFVTKLAKSVYRELESMDLKKKKDKSIEKAKKEAKRNRDNEKTKDSWIEDSIASEQVVIENKVDIKYSFLDPITKLTDYEIKEEFSDARDTNKEILDMAYRGIGIHHDALPRKYKSAVEILFRKKHLRVLFATESLALGINMPCRTVVFAGDSLQLDPMNYKQMSGRAGRRGYDMLGNVVFLGIPKNRVKNLMVSMLPEVQGAYTYSNTSLVSFKIEESIISNPLLSASNRFNQQDNSENGSSQFIFNMLENQEKRQILVNYQKSIYNHIYPSNYLWDLIISNRDFDPSIFIFTILFESNNISYKTDEFMKTIAFLFETVPSHFINKLSINDLPENTANFILNINSIYKKDLFRFYSNKLKTLQNQSSRPLHHINSFLYTFEEPRNSYIYDFFTHGSSVRIFTKNGIPEGKLWHSLFRINNFLNSFIRLLETYYDLKDERLRKLKNISTIFNKKFEEIFA